MNASPRILVVDDQTSLLEIVASLIRKILPDSEVDTCSDGNVAISKAAENDYDLVLTDVMIPGPTGIQVCHYIKQTGSLSRTKVVTMTGFSSAGVRLEAMLHGVDGYLPKPFDENALKKAITDALEA